MKLISSSATVGCLLRLHVFANAFMIHSPFVPSSFLVRGGGTCSTSINSAAADSKSESSASSSRSTFVEDTTTSSCSSQILFHDEDFKRPDPDPRKYRAIRLANNLQVLLVSSPESDSEAAAVHVKAGHMDDPDHRPGLAHFHEHMLFLGTKKYPSENEYEAFLSRYGGSSNAYTDMEDTNYYFDITPRAPTSTGSGTTSLEDEEDGEEFVQGEQEEEINEIFNQNVYTNVEEQDHDSSRASVGLHGALDRFAQFFVSPSFNTSMVDREMRAIDSEYRNSLTSDSWRNFMLLKSSASPQHPFSKFGCGNFNTLTQGGAIINTTHSDHISSFPTNDLIQFWNDHYKTFNLRLCVMGRASLDALQASVEETFGQLPYSEGGLRKRATRINQAGVETLEYAQYNGTVAFGPEQLGKVYHVKPVVETRSMKVFFGVPPMDDPQFTNSRPHRVISHLLGHESPGSLHALLNEEGYINDLSSGVGVESSDFSLFSISLSLTPKGMRNRDKILDLIFQYIALIRNAIHENEDMMIEFHNELQQLNKMEFRFRENSDPSGFCSKASQLMFRYPANKVLVGPGDMGDYDSTLAKAWMERLRPENALIKIISADFDITQDDWNVEKWYGANYQVRDITDDEKVQWSNPNGIDARLKIPDFNRYIPNDFSLRCDDETNSGVSSVDDTETMELEPEPPVLLVEKPGFRMWHKMDTKWRVPKTSILLSLETPDVYRSPQTMTGSRLFERILRDDLTSFVYDATVAGCGYRVSVLPEGFRISLRGYSEKLPYLLDRVSARIFSLIQELKEGPEVHPGLAMKFRKARGGLLRETKNFRLDPPYEIGSYNARLIMEETTWTLQNYIDILESEKSGRSPMTMQECGQIAGDAFGGRIRTEAMCFGNINESETRDVADLISNRIMSGSRPLDDEEISNHRSMKLPTFSEAKALFGEGTSDIAPIVYQEVARAESEVNNSMELILQCGCEHSLGVHGVAIASLFAHMAYNSAYDTLRTQNQLGYIVSCSVRKSTGGGWAIAVLVQSSVALPSVLEAKSEEWLQSFRTKIENMDLDDLVKESSAIVAILLERDTKLSEEVGRFWGAISSTGNYPAALRTPNFKKMQLLANELLVSRNGEDDTKSASQLKQELLDFFDKYFARDSPERRAMSSRVYSQQSRQEFDENMGKPGVFSTYDDISYLKQFMQTYPLAPYWVALPGK